MKNLFKNLMLVAVAAMAFTACTESNNEVNAVTKKVVLEFVADLADDDTRVAFGEKDGNKYPVVWEAYDNVSVKVGEKQAWYTLTEEDVLESGKKAIIRPEFELLEDETLSGDIVATVNENVLFDNHQGNKPTISLKAEAVYPATNLVFEHQYAYGKMELVGLPAEFNVTEVKLNLVGGGKELNHTISGNSVEDNIFWFTTEAMEAVESFAVYASNGAVTYYREVTVEKNFAFEVGKVSAFRVKELVVKPADFNVQLTKITSMSNNVIRFEGDDAEDNITITFNPGLENIIAGHYDAVGQDWFNGGVWAWSSDSALEVKDEFEGSSVDVNAAGGISWYYSQNGVDVTVDGDVYTIVAHLKNYTSAGNKTVDFTYVGKLEAPEEPEAPKTLVFTSARWVNTSLSDKLVQFYTADGATLQLNWYNCGSDNWIVPNTYGFAFSGAIYGGGDFSWYENEAFEIDTEIVDGTVIVSVVDGQYYIEFKNLADYSAVQIESATFTGAIEGLILPDMRTILAAPSNITSTVDGKTITLSWKDVEGADCYRVKLYSPYEEYFETFVEDPEFEYEAANYSTQYSFTIMSYASETNAQYRSSDDAYVDVTTGKDPNVFADYVLDYVTVNSNYFEFNHDWHNGSANTKTSLRIYMHADDKGSNFINPGQYTCLGQGANTPSSAGKVNFRYCTDTWAYYYSTANTSATLDVSIENGEYVIIATIDGKTWGYKGMPEGWVDPSEGGSGNEGGSGDEGDSDDPVYELGTVNNPYTFTTCDVFAAMYPKLTFSGAEDGATLTLESNTSYGLPTGVITLGNNGWWSSGHSYSLGEIDPGYSYSSIDQNGDGSYTINYIMIKSGSKTVYYRYSGGSIL